MATLTLITIAELRRRIPYSRQHFLRLEAAGRFPRRIKFDPNGKSFWNEAEITAWLAERLAERDTDVPPDDDHETGAQ